MADDELREESREQWAGVAQNWAGRSEQLSGVRDHAVEHAAVHAQPDGSVRLPARVTLGRAVRPA